MAQHARLDIGQDPTNLRRRRLAASLYCRKADAAHALLQITNSCWGLLLLKLC